MTRRFNPRTAALAYRIWAYCAPRGWNCTVGEVAEELGERMHVVRQVCIQKKWNERLAGVSVNAIDRHGSLMAEVDEQLRIGL